MTIFYTVFFSVAIARAIEQFIYFCIYCISRLTSKRNSKQVSAPDHKRLVATVTPEIYEVIKNHCTLNGMTVTQYTLCAVIEKLRREGVLDA